MVSGTQLALDLARHRLVGVILIRIALNRPGLDADHDAAVGRLIAFSAAEILQLGFGKTQTVHLDAHLADIDGLGCLQLHQHAAGEIDTQAETVQQDREYRNNHQQSVEPKGPKAVFDEIDVGGLGDEPQQRHGCRPSKIRANLQGAAAANKQPAGMAEIPASARVSPSTRGNAS